MGGASARRDTRALGGDEWATPHAAATASRMVRRVQLRALIAAGDLLAMALGTGVSGSLRLHAWLHEQTLGIMAVSSPVFLSFALKNGAFGFDAIERWQKGVRRALPALTMAALILLGVGFAFKIGAAFSRVAVVTGFLLSAVLMTGCRWLTGKAVAAAMPDGLVDEVTLVDGADEWRHRTGRVVNAQALDLRPSLDCPHLLDRLGRALRHCDRVLIACSPDKRQAWTAALKGLGVEVQVLIPEIDALGVLGTSQSGGRLVAVVARGPLRTTDAMVKRGFDLAVSLFFLPVLLLVTAAVAVAIKLEDGGPLFFRQTRIGQGNRQFRVLKFRSMRTLLADADGRHSTARNDARVTRVGSLLRATSLDELPQLFNVLRGDMSIVGPRPHALGSTAADALFWEVDRRYWLRHAVKPGLTGLAQVRGFRGATRTTDDLTNRVQADLEYIMGWSLWRDIRIVAATLRVLLHPNAY